MVDPSNSNKGKMVLGPEKTAHGQARQPDEAVIGTSAK